MIILLPQYEQNICSLPSSIGNVAPHSGHFTEVNFIAMIIPLVHYFKYILHIIIFILTHILLKRNLALIQKEGLKSPSLCK